MGQGGPKYWTRGMSGLRGNGSGRGIDKGGEGHDGWPIQARFWLEWVGLSAMFTHHRLGPPNKLDCPHAMGTDAFSPQRAEPLRHFLLLPSRSLANQRRKPTNLRVSPGTGAAQLQASGLRVRSHAGSCSPPAQRTAPGNFPTQAKNGLEWATRRA
jgi:hypothetical protein